MRSSSAVRSTEGSPCPLATRCQPSQRADSPPSTLPARMTPLPHPGPFSGRTCASSAGRCEGTPRSVLARGHGERLVLRDAPHDELSRATTTTPPSAGSPPRPGSDAGPLRGAGRQPMSSRIRAIHRPPGTPSNEPASARRAHRLRMPPPHLQSHSPNTSHAHEHSPVVTLQPETSLQACAARSESELVTPRKSPPIMSPCRAARSHSSFASRHTYLPVAGWSRMHPARSTHGARPRPAHDAEGVASEPVLVVL